MLNKKSLVKITSAITLISVIVAALLGLGLLFSIFESNWWIERVLLSCLTLVVAGVLAFNSIRAMTSGNKVGVIAGILIPVSAVLFLILIWLVNVLGDLFSPFLYVVVIVSAISILLNIIISNYVALGKSLLLLQVIFYLLVAYVIFVLSALILGYPSLIVNLWMVFAAVIIVMLTLFIVLVVKKKTILQNETEKIAEGYIKIRKSEYEEMKAEIARLKALAGEAEENK